MFASGRPGAARPRPRVRAVYRTQAQKPLRRAAQCPPLRKPLLRQQPPAVGTTLSRLDVVIAPDVKPDSEGVHLRGLGFDDFLAQLE